MAENEFNRDMEKVRRNGMALEYVEEQTPEVCMEAVKQDGRALKYVKEQIPEICMEAVKQNGWALEYVREQTPEICLEAVKQGGKALQFVEEQTAEICMEAVKQNSNALEYVEPQFRDAVSRDINEIKMTQEKVLENLKMLIGQELDCDEVICAFGDFEEGGETDVYVGKSDNIGYDYIAYINAKESTQFLISVEKIFNDETGRLEKEIIKDIQQDNNALTYVQSQFKDAVSGDVNQWDAAIEEALEAAEIPEPELEMEM